MQEYIYQEGNVLISVVIPDSDEPIIRFGNEQLSIAQWDRLVDKVYGKLNEEIE